MKLTQKQQETVDKFLELENEYGKGNVFIRWINPYWNTMFIIHQKGKEKFDCQLHNSFKVNGRILKSLEEKGMLQCQDINHEKVENPNTAWRDGIKVLGSRIVIKE